MLNRFIVLLSLAAALTDCPVPANSQDEPQAQKFSSPQALQVLTELRARPAWLFPAEGCPADVMPDYETTIRYNASDCKPHLRNCADDCRNSDAAACYALALAIQEPGDTDLVTEALFFRACRLGIPSGCTNRAAGMTLIDPDGQETNACAVRTFEKTCDRDDPWGCTMLALHLWTGKGVAVDLDRAGRVLGKSCIYGERDPACSYAKRIAEGIAGSKTKEPTTP